MYQTVTDSQNNRLLLACFLFLGLIACQPKKTVQSRLDTPKKKSALVQKLEGIFYADGFASIPSAVFKVNDYGAKGDSTTLNTEAIQSAIDAANAGGGGIVTFDQGIYLSGALFLKSNVELQVAEGVTIKAIQDDAHFPDKWTRVAGVEMNWPAALINIYQQKNVRITGNGIIDGNGKYWWDKFWGDPPRSGGMWVNYTERDIRWAVDYDCKRVRAVVVYESEQVALKDITILRSGFWTISLTYSNKVHVDGVTIRNNIGGFGPSSDGINTDSSSDVLVENCDIDCNDDNLCIKAGRDSDGLRVNRVAENIVYRNCITRAGHGLFTIGSETSGGMRNVEVYGLEAIGTNTGIRFKSAKVRGGLIENIWFHDIKMNQVASPFHFELNWYPEYSYPTIPETEKSTDMPRHWKVMTRHVQPPEKGIPEFRNLTFSNIQVSEAEQGIYANAYAEKPMHNLHWENVHIQAKKAGEINHAADWTMQEVTLATMGKTPIKVANGSKVALPEWTKIDGDQDAIQVSPNTSQTRVAPKGNGKQLSPFNPKNQQVITANDTTIFSTEMTIHVPNIETDKIQFYEPLGDGFYYSPITIRKENNQLIFNGERKHNWEIRIVAPEKPTEVNGVDSWQYDAKESAITAQKNGMQFTIEIKN